MSEDREPDLIGQTLCGRWHLVRLLGRGGTSAVYEGRDPEGIRVAVKVLSRPSMRSTSSRERFLRERRAADAVAHAGTVRVFAEGEALDGHPFLVMELLEGRTLRAACDAAEARLGTRTVLEIAACVLDVLAHAHAVGVVHRDIKPENIFLTARGGVKVLDFGIAALRDEALEGKSITQSGQMLGTPAFMAPEQARGRQADVTAQTDVWAVGATMFYCLTGRYVHDGASNANEAIIFAATLRAAPVSKLKPGLPPCVARIVDRALALEPNERWSSAGAMRDAILSALAGSAEEAATPVHAPWTAETLEDPRPVARHPLSRGALPWAAAGVVVVSSLVSGVMRGEGRPPTTRGPEAAAARSSIPASLAASTPPPDPAPSMQARSPEAPRKGIVVRPAPAVPRTGPRRDSGDGPSASATALPSSNGLEVPDSLLDRWK